LSESYDRPDRFLKPVRFGRAKKAPRHKHAKGLFLWSKSELTETQKYLKINKINITKYF